jgi:16S rRNA (uracil1498-N3)-methyltransferase
MHLFHCAHLSSDSVDLPEEEAHHAVHVLRLGPGARIGLLDGRGGRAEAEITAAGKGRCTAVIRARTQAQAERSARIHLAIAPTKQSERLEWLVEKATEVGVDRITPLLTTRTERERLRTDRLQRVALAAMKQSQRAWLPRIDAPTALAALITDPLPAQRFFGWCAEQTASLMEAYSPAEDAVVLIGPEGDFDEAEARLLRERGFRAVSLGNARLRTETAAIAAITWMSLAQQR